MTKAKTQKFGIPLGQRLREHREQAALRQDQVARRARDAGRNWKSATVAAIETGKRELSLDEFFALRGFPATDEVLRDLFDKAAGWGRAFAKVRSEAALDAEIKAARKFEVAPDAIVSASRRLWGRTLTEERDRLLQLNSETGQGARARQALRGHITRQLLGQLAAAVGKGKRRP